jgi:hypothetical protein
MTDHVERLLARLDELRAAIEAERQRHEETLRPLVTERNQILHALEQAGLSRRQLAEAAGMTSASSVQKILKPPQRDR